MKEPESLVVFQAVQQYTGSEKIHVVSHAMGVTLSRKAIQGGNITASDGSFSLLVFFRMSPSLRYTPSSQAAATSGSR